MARRDESQRMRAAALWHMMQAAYFERHAMLPLLIFATALSLTILPL